LKDEVYVLLVDWEPINQAGTTFKVFVNPLVNWLWMGSFLFIFGIIIAAWPEKEAQRVSVRSDKRIHQASAAD
jgi:cytochrome c-type biogenesis protein CcmF